ncbi:MAG: hypothetical protein RLY43_265 [Bacteroidota bacterium]
MIIFDGTKKVGLQTFLVFKNDFGSSVQIPLDDKIISYLLLHFDRLSPGTKMRVEQGVESSDSSV